VGSDADAEGRYCLNDLHRAAGGEKRHQPSDWLRLQQTQDLVAELATTSIPGIPGIESKQGLGTYVAKELVYAYAMWISAAFHLKVIRAYDAMVTQPTPNHVNLSRLQLIELATQAEQEFANWIKGRIEKYGFVEGEDFTVDKFINGRATVIDYRRCCANVCCTHWFRLTPAAAAASVARSWIDAGTRTTNRPENFLYGSMPRSRHTDRKVCSDCMPSWCN
jgi:hypothetical protein